MCPALQLGRALHLAFTEEFGPRAGLRMLLCFRAWVWGWCVPPFIPSGPTASTPCSVWCSGEEEVHAAGHYLGLGWAAGAHAALWASHPRGSWSGWEGT